MIRPCALVLCLVLGTFAAAPVAAAEPAEKIARIGFLRPGSPPDPFVDAFRQGLRELGYVEGRNVTIEYRWADGKEEQLPKLAGELVALDVDVIVAAANAAVAAKQVTATVPIVMPVSADPVGVGLVASLARPGGNVTGFATQGDELAGKWIELLKEALPEVSRVAVLWDPDSDQSQLRVLEASARSLGVRVLVLNARSPADFESAFAEAHRNRAGAIVVMSSQLFYAHRARLVELAARQRLPAMYHQKEFVVGSGGLMSYGANFHELFRRAAGKVDKILKGAKPADLPVEQPTKFELAINLKTARTLGVKIPRSLVQRADQIVQ